MKLTTSQKLTYVELIPVFWAILVVGVIDTFTYLIIPKGTSIGFTIFALLFMGSCMWALIYMMVDYSLWRVRYDLKNRQEEELASFYQEKSQPQK